MDNHTKEQRRRNMQAVKNKDSNIEKKLRQELWARGLRYRKNCPTVFGKPDIAFIGRKIAVFATVSFGMVTIGKTKRIISKAAGTFGGLKLKKHAARQKSHGTTYS